jgi:hypothetical protein
MGLKRLACIAAALTVWYAYSGNSNRFNPSLQDPTYTAAIKEEHQKKYELPKEIKTIDGIVNTDTIDFNNNFKIKTDRYTLVRDKDYLLSRGIGYVLSAPTKLFFWDSDAGKGLDAEHSRQVLALLEEDKTLKNITVRINHTSAWYDFGRLFTDDKVTERNNLLARIVIGVPSLVLEEIWAEYFRGDYYNPMNQTAVLYSNIDCVPKHEIGHHRDHQRFDADWWYSLTRFIPPVMVYQEWKASDYAKKDLNAENYYQYDRYLIPALGTYVLAAIGAMYRLFFGKDDEEKRRRRRY